MSSQSNGDTLGLAGLGRGIFALKSFEPCRRPGDSSQSSNSSSSGNSETTQKRTASAAETVVKAPIAKNPANNNSIDAHAPSNDKQPIKPTNTSNSKESEEETELLAKYSYTANPARPGGFDELTFKQGDRLWRIRTHPANEHWMEARHDNGSCGFVPSSYMKIIEKQVSGLPWLKKSQEASEPVKAESVVIDHPVFGAPPQDLLDKKQQFKAYVPTYGSGQMTASQAADRFYCDLCDKQLNGPLPYKAHMNSKMHKEEVEARKYYD